MFKQLAKALIRLHMYIGWSELSLVAHTILEISCCGSLCIDNVFCNSFHASNNFCLITFAKSVLPLSGSKNVGPYFFMSK